MSKTYILRKNIDAPTGSVLAGTESIFDGAFYCFPYIHRKYNQDKNGWLGNSFMCRNPEMMPEWFVLKPDSNIGKQMDIQNALSMLHHEGYKIISPEENKSTDSFQWTDELAKKAVYELAKKYGCGNWVGFEKEFERWKTDNTPKPQAENKPIIPPFKFDKPDWEIVKYEFVPLSKEGHPFWIENTSVHWRNAKTDTDFKIFAVKRLSDGEVFSVGDTISTYKIGGDGFSAKIEQFFIPGGNDDIYVYFDRHKEAFKVSDWLKNAHKASFKPDKKEEKFDGKKSNRFALDELGTWMGPPSPHEIAELREWLGKRYTEEEMNKLIEKAWEAGRHGVPFHEFKSKSKQ